jgi:nucleotide-binding universal stress UspA family protein
MVRSILVPLDGSAVSERALPLAVSLARRLNAAIQLVHVHAPLWGASPDSDPLDKAAHERERAYLDTTVNRLAAEAGVPLSCALLEGPTAETISRHVTQNEIDLVVLVSRSRCPLTRFWLGSVADALIRQISTPVLLVPPESTSLDFSDDAWPGHVLIPLDGSELSEQIVGPAIAVGEAANAQFTVLRVIQPMLPGYPPISGQCSGTALQQLQVLHSAEQSDAYACLNRIAERLHRRSLPVQSLVASHDSASIAILERASGLEVDLIAVATQGRGGLQRMLLGSVADKVIRGATTPVLVYRPVETLEDVAQHAEAPMRRVEQCAV